LTRQQHSERQLEDAYDMQRGSLRTSLLKRFKRILMRQTLTICCRWTGRALEVSPVHHWFFAISACAGKR
jgi:hypothetical protein